MNIQKILSMLHKTFDSSPINWLEACEFSLKENELHLSFLHPFIQDWFNAKDRVNLESLLKAQYPEINLVINKFNKVVCASRDAVRAANRSRVTRPSGGSGEKGQNSQRDYLADFIYNDKNALAVKAAHSLSQKKIAENFPHLALFFGSPGSGKSHLLKAIYQKQRHNGIIKCSFFSAKKLAHSLLALDDCHNAAESSSSMLLIDDLQELENSPSALSLMTSVFDLALNERGQLWVVASLAAENLHKATLYERLRSRLEQGIYFELHPADLDIRLRFVEKLNREKNLGLNRVQLINIARLSSKLTEAMGLMHKVEFFKTFMGQTPSKQDLDRVLATNSAEPPFDWQKLLEKVARRLNLKTDEILGSRRKPEYVLGRQIVMYLARKQLALSFQEIGKLFGGKDHSTVMHAVKKIQQLRDNDEDLHKLLKELEK